MKINRRIPPFSLHGLLIPALIFAVSGAFSQAAAVPPAKYETILRIEEPALQVSIDPFTNLYILREGREFVKYDRDGREEASYTDIQLSEFSEISSDHPFKSMIYYPEFDLIRVFGNKLQVLAELDLTLFRFGEITAIAPSTGYQSFWVFDATAQRLIRINQQYEIADPGADIIPYTGEPIFPTIIKEREGWVYVYDPERGMYIFDSFGTYSKHLNMTGATSFSVFKDRLFFIADGELYEMDLLANVPVKWNVKLDGNILTMTFRQIVLQRNKGLEVIRF